MVTKNFLAIDLGAESGRAVVGRFDGESLALEEVHRFSNGPVRLLDSLYWNTLALFTEIKNGLSKTINGAGIELAGLALDTWGVDFGLLDRSGALLGNPRHYRDGRTEGMVEKACSIVPRPEIFRQTGIQFLPLNTLTQLLAMVEQGDPTLDAADTLLTMPDLFNYWLTGQKVSEYTNASTTQCLNMATGRWATGLLEQLGIPTHILPEVIAPGSRLGTLLPHIADEVGITTDLDVIAPATHDTGSAVAAIPVTGATRGNYAYISSGTWSLVGQETPAPIINEESLNYNFTNEGGVQATIRLLKNVGGLWLVQESRRTWAREGCEYSYSDLTKMAEAAPPFVALINPDDPLFVAPGDMPARIRSFCERTGQAAPQSEGEFVRCALESLALRYRWVINRAAELSGQPVEVVHIVGGGSQNRLLNQFTANATGRPVVAGPVEATAIGNVLMQMLTLGQISSLSEGRALVGRSFPVETYEPQDGAAWEEAYQRYMRDIQTNDRGT